LAYVRLRCAASWVGERDIERVKALAVDDPVAALTDEDRQWLMAHGWKP
jgi:hypothetical protein